MKNCFVFPEMYTKVLSTGLPPATTFFHLYHPAVFTFIKPNAGLERDRRVTIFWHQHSYLCYQVKWKQNCKDERATDPAHKVFSRRKHLSKFRFGPLVVVCEMRTTYTYFIRLFLFLYREEKKVRRLTSFRAQLHTYKHAAYLRYAIYIILEKLFFL